jgi:hypothetical protein
MELAACSQVIEYELFSQHFCSFGRLAALSSGLEQLVDSESNSLPGPKGLTLILGFHRFGSSFQAICKISIL